MTSFPDDALESAPAPAAARAPWNHAHNWIIALVAAVLAGVIIFSYVYVWLPPIFAGLIDQGLPGYGENAQRVYSLTTLIFALPGIAVIGPVLWWHFRPSRVSRITVLVVASLWFLLSAPSGIGRYGSGGSGLSETVLVRAGASPEVTELWGAAIRGGSLISIALGIAAGLFVLVRFTKVHSRNTAQSARTATRKSNRKSDMKAAHKRAKARSTSPSEKR
jgi:hypothetical protein